MTWEGHGTTEDANARGGGPLAVLKGMRPRTAGEAIAGEGEGNGDWKTQENKWKCINGRQLSKRRLTRSSGMHSLPESMRG